MIRSLKFLSPVVALYLYKSTIRSCMKYCCHAWTGAPSFLLELLDKQQKRIFRAVYLLLAASLEPLGHRRNVASLRLKTLVEVHLNWLNWFYVYILQECLIVILID